MAMAMVISCCSKGSFRKRVLNECSSLSVPHFSRRIWNTKLAQNFRLATPRYAHTHHPRNFPGSIWVEWEERGVTTPIGKVKILSIPYFQMTISVPPPNPIYFQHMSFLVSVLKSTPNHSPLNIEVSVRPFKMRHRTRMIILNGLMDWPKGGGFSLPSFLPTNKKDCK